MSRLVVLVYGVLCYVLFLGTFLYAIGFLGNWLVPRSIDQGLEESWPLALAVDVLLLGLFAVPHSVMARAWFKAWWARLIPAVVERSTYVLVSSLLLALLFWQWRPIPERVWHVEAFLGQLLLQALFWAGWGLVLLATFLTNHFDLFGLRQVYLYAQGQPYTPVGFRVPLFYRFVRHPLMLGFLIAFWATPTMTVGRLLFAVATTGYILIGTDLEERDLLRMHGSYYEEYCKQVGRFFPRLGKRLG